VAVVVHAMMDLVGGPTGLIFTIAFFIVVPALCYPLLKMSGKMGHMAGERLRDYTSGSDRGKLTDYKARTLTEKQARAIYGDEEVDRYNQHGE
jgi:hypothetical protein